MVANPRALHSGFACLSCDCGLMEYESCLSFQRLLQEAVIAGRFGGVLVLVEHPPVLTIGRRGDRRNILVGLEELRAKGVRLFHIERGGDVTYHGPGQLVAYPIFRLRAAGLGIADFVRGLEEVMIRTLRRWGINGSRDPVNRGVWIQERKIGSLGVAVRRGVSLHGLALNVNTELAYFDIINPCGLKGVEVTSIKELLGREIEMAEVKGEMGRRFEEVFGLRMEWTTPEDLVSMVQNRQTVAMRARSLEPNHA